MPETPPWTRARLAKYGVLLIVDGLACLALALVDRRPEKPFAQEYARRLAVKGVRRRVRERTGPAPPAS